MSYTPLVIADLSGGRNGFDAPINVPEDQCVEAMNVDWWEGECANKRGGSTSLSTTFSSGGPFTDTISSLLRHVPGNDETAAELWGFDGASTPVVGRLVGATTFVAPTLKDNLQNTAAALTVTGASLTGMFFLGYDSTQNRLHVWDPSLSKVRRVGLATPDPPTVATLGGAGLTFTRHYRIRVVDISGSDTRRRSEASTSVSLSITDDSGIRVTKPTLPGEDETHWEVEYADASTGPWYRASQVLVVTSTYDDTASTISTTNLSATTGINVPPPSARFLLTDDNRVVMAGCFETSGGFVTAKNNRVWWTPVVGSNDVGDSERIVTNETVGRGYLDVETAITGLGGPLQGAVYVFGYRRIWKLVPTGLASAPYQRFTISTSIGCIAHKTIFVADDENGAPCLYFLSHRGPYRIGPSGLQYLGTDIEDQWASVNLDATNVVAHGIYHAAKHQAWWWVASGAGNSPSLRLVFDTRRGRAAGDSVRKGWSLANGEGAIAWCSVMFSNTVAASMSRDLKPYIGQGTSTNRIWKCDSSATNDAGTNFQAYVDTKEYGALGRRHAVNSGVLVGQVASGVTITVTARSDFALETNAAGTAVLTAAASETRVQKRLDALQTAGVGTFAFRIGDGSAASNQWTVDAVLVYVEQQEALVA